MTKLIEVILIIIALWFLVNLAAMILKRRKLIKRLKALKRETGAEMRFVRFPYRSLFSLSAVPEIMLKIGNTLYLVRMYNGGGIGKAVHFASETYTVRFSRMKTAVYVGRPTRRRLVTATRGFAVGSKVIPFPRLKDDTVKGDGDTRIVPVLIFNPAPGEVSFVTPEKTSIKVAFTGDEVYGTRIFTASTFVTYAERSYRAELELQRSQEPETKASDEDDFSYFSDYS
jgi:hypothetical protein